VHISVLLRWQTVYRQLAGLSVLLASQLTLQTENVGIDPLLDDLAVLELEDRDLGDLNMISGWWVIKKLAQIGPA